MFIVHIPFFHVTQECVCVHTCACIMFVLLVKTRPVVVFCILNIVWLHICIGRGILQNAECRTSNDSES